MATPLVGDHGARLVTGRSFIKMSGSGNDFIFFDARVEPAGHLAEPAAIRALCARGTGVGADGVVFVEPSASGAFAIRYFNSDGSLAELCGNASLCSVRLATDLGAAPPDGFAFETGSGILRGRLRHGEPEIDTNPVAELEPAFNEPLHRGERRIGFAQVGVPHLVVLCDDVTEVDVETRGRFLRRLPRLRDGANVNFVSPGRAEWWLRTYERGVEGETLACGTGAVAAAALLGSWGVGEEPTRLVTRSGRALTVRSSGDGLPRRPSLSGEGRVVFSGTLADLVIAGNDPPVDG